MFNATFNNISVISWLPLAEENPEYPEKTTKLLHVTDKFYYIMLYPGRLVMSRIRTYNVIGNRHRFRPRHPLFRIELLPKWCFPLTKNGENQTNIPNIMEIMVIRKYIPITYIVWWYKTLYQVEYVVWTSITTSRESDELWCGQFTQQTRPDTQSCTTTLCM